MLAPDTSSSTLIQRLISQDPKCLPLVILLLIEGAEVDQHDGRETVILAVALSFFCHFRAAYVFDGVFRPDSPCEILSSLMIGSCEGC